MGYFDLISSYSNQTRVVEAPASGAGHSQNGKFSYGYASSAGKRSSMEDFFETRIDGIDGEIVGLFGVFDGHGGARAAEYVKRHLFSNLITHPKFISDTKSAIADAYNHTDSELLKSENSHTRDAGSTASTAILVGDRLLVANVGDSRAVICRGGNAFAVSRDHKPDQSDERERIENAGGFVMWAGTWRVGGVLAVSRAFGDRLLKQYVVADPEIQEEKIDDSLEFLILASDGLWDVFSNEEAVAVVKEVEDPEESTKKLVGEAIKRGSADNITCVVVRFLESKNANNKASHISSMYASSSREANQGKIAARNDLDHKISSAKETNQEDTTTHIDLDRNSENENLNQKPVAARNDDSGRISVTQKPNVIPSAGRGVSSEQKGSACEKNQMPITIRGSSAKHLGQGQTTVRDNQKQAIAAHIDLDCTSKNEIEKLNQKPDVARNDDSGQISSTQKLNAILAADGGLSSKQRGSAGEKNQMPITIRSSAEPNISAKHPSQWQTTLCDNQKKAIAADIDLNCNSENEKLNQKPDVARNDDSRRISSTQKPNAIPAAGPGISSEQKDSSGQKNQTSITIRSSAKPNISAKHTGQGQTTVRDNQKQTIAATHTTSLEQSESKAEKNRKPNTIHSNSTKSKASSVHSITN